MKKSFLFLFVFFSIACGKSLFAQVEDSSFLSKKVPDNKVYRVAVFAPMYLDSIFTQGNLNSQKTIPKFVMPAVDFVQGAQIAFDTLRLNGKKLEAVIYDSKSYSQPIPWLATNKKFDNIDLIIGSVKEPEYTQLAQIAFEKNIPFISATYPNDGNVRQNPFLVILNSTLKAHCESIYDYINSKHGTDNIYLIKKKNDNFIENYFKEINLVPGNRQLKITTIALDSSISSQALRNRLDTTKPIVIIGASLDKIFSVKLADALYPIQKTVPIALIGMPNWDGFSNFYKKDSYKDFPILYTTPHYDAKTNAHSNNLIKQYFTLYRAKPSDMAYKGFEAAYYFTNILLNYPGEIMSHLNENSFACFHDFNFGPVYSNGATAGIPNYFENKHLFFMQIMNGEVNRVY